MADIPTYYIAKEDLQAYLGVTLTAQGIAQFNVMLPAMQLMVDNYCNRSWAGTAGEPVIETFDAIAAETAPFAQDTFFTKCEISQTPAHEDCPLAKGVISVNVGGVPWDNHYVYSYDDHIKLWVRPQTIMLPNPLGFKSITITYNSDDPGNCPAAIKQALVEWIARKVQTSSDSNKEVGSVQAGTVNVRYITDKVGGMPDFVKMVLDTYRFMPLEVL